VCRSLCNQFLPLRKCQSAWRIGFAKAHWTVRHFGKGQTLAVERGCERVVSLRQLWASLH
jgi:hypothetical protein